MLNPFVKIPEFNTLRKEVEIGRVKGEVFGVKYNPAITIEIEFRKVDGKLELAISGEVLNYKRTDIWKAGQIQDSLREWLENGKLIINKRYTKEDIEKLLDIWDTWHLNATKPIPYEGRKDVEEVVKIYQKYHNGKYPDFTVINAIIPHYGIKHYYWELPQDVIDWICDKFGINKDDIDKLPHNWY